MNITCELIKVNNPKSLFSESLPEFNLEVIQSGHEIPHIDLLEDQINSFNKQGDVLLNEIFSSFYRKSSFEIAVVATQGVPKPYDAWTAIYRGGQAIFFNLSVWEKEKLQKKGLSIIIHEITHVLLAELIKPPINTPIEILNTIMLDEGLAHFTGYSGDRKMLLSDEVKRWHAAEKMLEEAKEKLLKADLSQIDVDAIIKAAHTGPYWEKYGAISGMFRAAFVYQKRGAEGLINAIKQGHLSSAKEI